jgi:hypothetical protein
MTLQVILAAVLAIASSEFALRWIHLQPTEWLVRDEEPRRQDDPQLGWVLAPRRTGRRPVAERTLEYAVDAAGYRVRRVDEPVNSERPTIVFAGESVMFGEGLAWEESIPAQVSAILGIQSANLAVHGYSTDQIYLRLARELPRFRQPVAVVSIFMTELFGRNLDDDRPHLGPGLVWQPAEHESRLMSLAGLVVPYRRDTTVERGVRVTREVFLAIVELARRRGATPLVIIPEFGSENGFSPTTFRWSWSTSILIGVWRGTGIRTPTQHVSSPRPSRRGFGPDSRTIIAHVRSDAYRSRRERRLTVASVVPTLFGVPPDSRGDHSSVDHRVERHVDHAHRYGRRLRSVSPCTPQSL